MSGYDPKTDYLKQDPYIPGQNWSVISFVNPKDNVLNKMLHYVNKFMIADINKQLTAQAVQMARKLSVEMRGKITDVLDKLKYSLDEEDKALSRLLEDRYREMSIDEDGFVEECRRKYELDAQELEDRYKVYLSQNRVELDRAYDEAHDQQTSLRAFKVRGTFARLEDAREKAKYLRDEIEPAIHTFVVQSGTWFPVDMEADEVQDQDYMLPALNELMGKYHESAHARNMHYQERKRELQEASTQGNRKTVRDRLREKQRQKVNEKMKQELAEIRGAAGVAEPASAPPSTKSKSKKHKKKSAAPAATAEADPALAPAPAPVPEASV